MNLQKKINALLKIRVILSIFFFHFLLDIISWSRYHIISYQHIFHRTFSSFSVNWEITKLMSIWNEFNGFFLFFFFFYTVYKLDQAKLIKDPEWIYIYFKKTLPKKNPHNTERKKKSLKNSKGSMQEFFLNPLLSLEDPTILKFASITLSHIFYPQSQNI